MKQINKPIGGWGGQWERERGRKRGRWIGRGRERWRGEGEGGREGGEREVEGERGRGMGERGERGERDGERSTLTLESQAALRRDPVCTVISYRYLSLGSLSGRGVTPN